VILLKTFHLCSSDEDCPLQDEISYQVNNHMKNSGLRYTKDYNNADFVILNTCGHIKDTLIRSMRAIEFYRKRCRTLIVVGCLPKIYSQKKTKKRVLFYPRDVKKIEKILGFSFDYTHIKRPYRRDFKFPLEKNLILRNAFAREFELNLTQFYLNPFDFSFLKKLKPSRVKAFINKKPQKKFMDNSCYIRACYGCLGNCTFCIEKKALGPLRSRNPKEIESELLSGLSEGYEHFVIHAEDLGYYGEDINLNFVELLKFLLPISDNYSVALTGLNPFGLLKNYNEFKKIIERYPHRFKRFLIPIQSGSDKILKCMGRLPNSEKLISTLLEIKEITGAKIETIIIVGFPGETKTDFHATLNLIKKVGFDYIRIHSYSDIPGTQANTFPDKIPNKLLVQRVKKLIDIQKAYGQYGWSIK